jgi:hypothetical protein
MIPSLTIDFDVVEARQNGRSAAAGRVLFSFTSPAKLNQMSLAREVVAMDRSQETMGGGEHHQ